MIQIDSPLKSIEIKLAGAVTTSQPAWTVSYVDLMMSDESVSSASMSDGTTNNTTAVPVIAAPALGHTRQLNALSVIQADTVAATVIIQLNNSGTKRILWQGLLQPNDVVQYSGGGFVLTGIATNTTALPLTGGIMLGSLLATDASYDLGGVGYRFKNLYLSGVLTVGSGSVQLTTAAGKIQAISSTYFDSLSGANLTSLTAANVSGSHTLPDGVLSTNIPLLNAANAFMDATVSSSTGTGAITTAGGVGITKALWVGGLANIAGVLTVSGNSATYGIVGDGTNGLGIAATNGSGAIRFYTGGTTERMRILETGGVSIGDATNPGAGSLRITSTTPLMLPNINSSAGTAMVVSFGYTYLLTSSARFKENIAPFTATREQLDAFLAVSPEWWDYKGKKNGAMGFISESLLNVPLVNAYGTNPLINYDKDGLPESNRDYALIGLQHEVLRDHESRLKALEEK